MHCNISSDELRKLMPDGFWVVSSQGKIVDVNNKYLEMSGYTKDEMLKLNISDLDVFQTAQEIKNKINDIISVGSAIFQTFHKKKSGAVFPVEIYAHFHTKNEQFIVFIRDIEHRRFYQNKNNIADQIFNSSIEAIMVTDAKGKIMLVNDAFCKITGYDKNEILGKSPSILKSDRQDKHFYRRFWRDIEQHGRWAGEIWNKRKNGDVYPEWLTVSSIQQNEKIVNYVAQFSDITEKKNSEEEKYFLAYHDHLTLLPNRSLLQERLEMLINMHQQQSINFAVIFIDLDRFKVINDSLGHHIGDDVLKILSSRIKDELRNHDTIARVGGDEFVVIVEGEESLRFIENIASKILTLIEKPITLNHGDFYLSASLGISLFPNHTLHLRELLSFADIAMYQAKDKGGNCFKVFDENLRDKALQRLEIESGLHKAVEQNELEVWYQPQINVAENKVYAAECLVRWRHPSLGLIRPDLFIPIAEETGLINAIGKFVLIEAINKLKEWQLTKVFDGMLAINISGKQLEQENFVQQLKDMLTISKISAKKIELEVTESTFEEGKVANIEKLRDLQKLGFKIAIDDFGTGYSSLKRIKTLPVDNLKIDKCFVDNITTSKEDESLVLTILNIAKTFNMDVIAEGIETKEQLKKLSELGVINNQGYLHSKPLEAPDFEKYIQLFKEKRNSNVN